MAEKKYIELEEVRDVLADEFGLTNDQEERIIGRINHRAKSIPAADVRPVVHGHYVGEYDGYADGNPVYDMWYCSECWCCFEDWDEKPTYNFCPNCGADMREPNLDTTKGGSHD